MTQPVELADRERAALTAIIDAIIPQLIYFCVWTYRVTGAQAGPPVTVSGKSTDPRVPNIDKIVLRQGPDGGYATPATGTLIGVAFLNADPSLPYVHSLDPLGTPGSSWQHANALVELGNSSAVAVVRDPWAIALTTALGTLAASLTSAVAVVPDINNAGAALTTALGALPPSGTTIVKAT